MILPMSEIAAWKDGCYYAANAQAVYDEICDIGEFATPQQIVEKARDEQTELHKCFEWNDDVAAEKYRIVQARQVARSLVIRRTEQQIERGLPQLRILHKPVGAEGYRRISFIVQDRDEYAATLEAAMRELRAFKAKYAHLSELSEIMELIE